MTEPKQENKVVAFIKKMTPDKHQKMERTARTMGVLGVTGLVLMSGLAYTSIDNRQTNIDGTSVFTASFTSSKTKNKGQVEKMYLSPDRSEAMVIFKFEDASLASTQADTYQAFVTAIDQDLNLVRLESAPTGAIISFGSTGYMGIVLKNKDGVPFPSQLLSITFRASNELTLSPEDSNAEVAKDIEAMTNNEKYDQWSLVVNPGANEVITSDLVTDGTLDYRKIYNDLVTAPEEAELKKQMAAQLAQMRTALAAMDDYHSRLEAVSIDGATLRIPDYPNSVESDQVGCVDGAEVCADDQLVLETDFTYGNGYNVNWLAGSVEDGYLDELTGGQDPLAYLTEKNKAESGAETLTAESWVLSNDRLLSSYDSSLRPVTDAQQLISQWIASIQRYEELKRTYQVSMGYEMLNLELNLKDASENTQVYDSSDAVRLY